MIKYLILVSTIAAAFAAPSFLDTDDYLRAAACTAENCKAPDCRCASTNIPGGLNASETPQVHFLFEYGLNKI